MGDPEIAVFGGGCFWCTEAVFGMLRGIRSVMPGYAGGSVPDPTYEQVSSGASGHAEVIRIEYDPMQISYKTLLMVFFATHDPSTLNRQGNDVGTQYRSVVFYTTEEQRAAAERAIATLNAASPYGAPVVTEVKPLDRFYPAEDDHHRYYERNKGALYCTVVINPKLTKLQKKFARLLKTA